MTLQHYLKQLIAIFNRRIFKLTTTRCHSKKFINFDYMDWRYIHLKSAVWFFSSLRGQGHCTLTQDIGILFHYTLHKFYGSLFYLVLGHCIEKITSNGGVHDKRKKRAMTRGIESSHLLGKAFLFFKQKKKLLDPKSEKWIELSGRIILIEIYIFGKKWKPWFLCVFK